ncbi:hypothetical protein [Quisquiliibacterium transsilvanicum]|jgi:hypothetical protein|uniref:Uncharacterized protein n=1 Tax=Quisquiliibacterium transsilvanicum TaxID=1549638 RepID=A0A7W8HIL7_9BURK|nr:hypothetical protein [Quisquiliibacterium transsilvanicum]MBB5272061.1 hypothetical protein [Quisquiliibacterium transsilvanicum]
MNTFYKRTLRASALAAAFLGIAVFLAVVAWKQQRAWSDSLQKLDAHARQVESLERDARRYAGIGARLGWGPGATLRREPVDLTALFRGGELARINELLAVTYTGSGFFSLDSLSIEKAGAQGAADAVRVTVKGENVLLVEKR